MAGIFHAYDVRGLVEKELTEDTMYLLGAGVAELINSRDDIASPLVIGRDGRDTSERFAQSFIDALVDRGIDVIDIGTCSTPHVYFAIRHFEAGGGAMITASHNPKEYNGLKLCNKEAMNLSPLEEAKPMMDFVENNTIETVTVTPEKKGTITSQSCIQEYINFLLNIADIREPLRIAADAGNGVGAVEFLPLVENLDIEIEPLHMRVDGTFPNHEANPTKYETLEELSKTVTRIHADFGIAFDGDADRIGFVDETGKILPADIIGCLLADNLLNQSEGAMIVHDLLCTKALGEVIANKKGVALRSRVGRHFITKHMNNNKNAIFGVEQSGHFFFRDFYGLDNPLFVFLHVANIVSQSGQTLSALVAPYQKFVSSPLVNVYVDDRIYALGKVKEKFADYTVDELDGVSVDADNFRFTVRQSNTEPLVRVSLEAENETTLIDVRKKIMEAIKD